ncbi:Hypothetical predicted protein, partial [Mytilus galloprovincialis]
EGFPNACDFNLGIDGKVDIQKFLSSHQSIKFDWNKVKVKIMNEKKERKRKIEKGLKWIKYK